MKGHVRAKRDRGAAEIDQPLDINPNAFSVVVVTSVKTELIDIDQQIFGSSQVFMGSRCDVV